MNDRPLSIFNLFSHLLNLFMSTYMPCTCLHFFFTAPELRFNWLSSLFGLAFLWGLAAYCMADPSAANASISSWLSVVTKVGKKCDPLFEKKWIAPSGLSFRSLLSFL